MKTWVIRLPGGGWFLGSVGLLWLANPLAAGPARAEPDEVPFHPTRILVKLKEGQQKIAGHPVLKQHGMKIRRQFKSPALQRLAVLDLANDAEAKAAKALAPEVRTRRLQERITALRATGKFEYVEPDYTRTLNAEPTDTAYTDGTLWALRNTDLGNGLQEVAIITLPAASDRQFYKLQVTQPAP